MAAKTNKPQTRNADQKWANRSWKPFLIMSIIGAVLVTIGSVLYVLGVAAIAEYPGTVPDEALGIFFGYLIGAIICWIGAGGLLGPGLPLMIITIIKGNKARARLGSKK